jgi:hypothetical protein
MEKIGKKDIIQILGIGLLLICLILPSYWLSEFTLYSSSWIVWLLGFYTVYLFPAYFLVLGVLFGLLWHFHKTAFSIAVIVAVMFSCFIANNVFVSTEYFYRLCYAVGYSWGGAISFLGIWIIYGLIAWCGFRLAYFGEK